MKRFSMVMLAAATLACVGCKNGPNNARDTTGMTNTSAAGSMRDTTGGATGAPAAGAIDTSKKKDSLSAKKP